MMKTPHRIILEEGASFRQSRPRINYVTYNGPLPKSRAQRAWTWVGYGLVALGVGVAAFVVTPAHAQGSMAPDVRVIVVSPSVTIMGLGAQASSGRQQEIQLKETLKHRSDMELEQLKSDNRRALEADKAYYEKLKFQRKQHGF